MNLPKLDKYEKFLEENILGFGLLKLERYYENISFLMKKTFEKSDFFEKLNDNLGNYNEEYLMDKGFKLFSINKPLKIDVKPFESMIHKCYRRDIINNPKWINEDFDWSRKKDWINPISCFETFTDILRTRVSVRYLDGAIFMAKKMKSLADSLELKNKLEYKAKEE